MGFRITVRFVLLVCALWVALAPAVGAVPTMIGAGNSMTEQADRTDPGCGDCPDMDMDPAACALICLGLSGPAVLPHPLGFAVAAEHSRYPELASLLCGRSASPEPGPPRAALS